MKSTSKSSMTGISTIIGGVFLAIILLSIAFFLLVVIDTISMLSESIQELAGAQAESNILAGSLSGWWLELGGDLYIYVESEAPRGILVTSIAIIWDDGSLTLVDQYNGSLSALSIYATVTKPDGTIESRDYLPIGLGPGYSLDIVFDNYGVGRDAVSVTLSLSGSPVTVISLPRYQELLQPNATGVVQAQLLGQLSRIAGSWTTTWSGVVEARSRIEEQGSIQSFTITSGVLVAGDERSLNRADNDNLEVDSVVVEINTTSLTLVNNNLLYATNFSHNPFTTGEWTTALQGTWTWSTTYGYEDGGIRVSDVGVDQPGIAYPVQLTLPSNRPYYVLVHIYKWICSEVYFYFDEYMGIALYRSSTEYYSAGVECDIRRDSLYIYFESYSDRRLSRDVSGIWVALLAYFDVVDGLFQARVFDVDSNQLGSNSLSATPRFTPVVAGTFSILENVFFDNFIVSLANPRWLNITVYYNDNPVPSGWTIELYRGDGVLVASSTTGPDGSASLEVLWQPIIWDPIIRIYDNRGDLVAEITGSSSGYSNIYGGNTYRVDIRRKIVNAIDLISSSVVTSINPSDLIDVAVEYEFSANISGEYSILVYDWVADRWVLIDSGFYIASSEISKTIWLYEAKNLDPTSFINSINNTILLRLVFISETGSAKILVDMLNSRIAYGVWSSFKAVLVGLGGTNIIEVYRVTTSGLEFLYSIRIGGVFNGSTLIAYDPISRKLVVANTTGLYTGYLEPRTKLYPLNPQIRGDCLPRGISVLEVVNDTSKSYAILVRSYDNSICIVDLVSNTTLARSYLSLYGLSLSDYPSSSRSTSNDIMYLVVVDQESLKPVLVAIPASASISITNLIDLPGSLPVGLVVGDREAWLLLERGSLYKLDLSNMTYSLLDSIVMPFIPWGPGDRLELFNTTMLLFVRADNTREIWGIPIGG